MFPYRQVSLFCSRSSQSYISIERDFHYEEHERSKPRRTKRRRQKRINMDPDFEEYRFSAPFEYKEHVGQGNFLPEPRGNNFEGIREPPEWDKPPGWQLSPQIEERRATFPDNDEFTMMPFEQRRSPRNDEFRNMEFSSTEGFQKPIPIEHKYGGSDHERVIYSRLSPGAGYYNRLKSPGGRRSPPKDVLGKMQFPPKERRGRSRSPHPCRRLSPQIERHRRLQSPRRERYGRPKSPRREEFGRPRSSGREVFPPNRKSRSPLRNEFRELGSSRREKFNKPPSPRREEFGKRKSNHREEFREPHLHRKEKFITSRSPHREELGKLHHREDFGRPHSSSREKIEHTRSPRRGEFGKPSRHREECRRSLSPRREKFDRPHSSQKIGFDKQSFSHSGSPGNLTVGRPLSPGHHVPYDRETPGHRFINDNPLPPNEFLSKRGITKPLTGLKTRTTEFKSRDVKTPDKTVAGMTDPVWSRSPPDSFNPYARQLNSPSSAPHWEEKFEPQIKKKKTDVTNDPLHVALRSNLQPVGAITGYQMELIKGYLFAELDKFLATNPKEPPKFSQLTYITGILSIRCENVMSLEWLKETVAQMPRLWEGPTSRIQVSLMSNPRTKYIKTRVYFNYEKTSADVIKGRLAAQNSWVNVRDWIIYNQATVGPGSDPTGSVVIFGVPQDHIKILLDRKRQLHYAFSKVWIKLPKSIKHPFKPDDIPSEEIQQSEVSDMHF